MKDLGLELALTLSRYVSDTRGYMMEYDSFHEIFDYTREAAVGGTPSIV